MGILVSPLAPYVAIGAIAVLAATNLYSYHSGKTRASDAIQAELARNAALTAQAHDEALQAAAAEIAKIEVKHVTIRQKAETVTREVPVYRDCRHDERGMQLLNEALTPGTQPAAQGELPRPDAAD